MIPKFIPEKIYNEYLRHFKNSATMHAMCEDYRDKDEIFDFIHDQKITGFCVVAGDRHAFHAGLPPNHCHQRNTNHWALSSLPVPYRSRLFSK
jgi:hypothetical protein